MTTITLEIEGPVLRPSGRWGWRVDCPDLQPFRLEGNAETQDEAEDMVRRSAGIAALEAVQIRSGGRVG